MREIREIRDGLYISGCPPAIALEARLQSSNVRDFSNQMFTSSASDLEPSSLLAAPRELPKYVSKDSQAETIIQVTWDRPAIMSTGFWEATRTA